MSEGFDPKNLDAEVKRKLEETERQRTAAVPEKSPPDPLLDIPEDAHQQEGGEHTPKEWREKLRGLITSAKEKLGMSESGERAKAYLAERSGALTEKAKGLGPVPEKLIRSLGERYNKLNWKYKLAISAGLIAGVGFSAVGSIPALIAGYGLVAQRGAGLAGMYVKFEKHLRETSEGKADGYWAKKEWYKKFAERPGWQRKAMAGVMAAGYTGLMSFGIHEAIGVIRGDESWGGQLHEWVKSHWPLGGSAGVHTDAIPSSTESLSTEGHGAGSATPESSTPETAPEVADADPGSTTAPETAPEATHAGAESVAGEPAHDGEVPQSSETEFHQPETASTADADAGGTEATVPVPEGSHEGSPESSVPEVETGTPVETSSVPAEGAGAESVDTTPAPIPEGSHEGSPTNLSSETVPEAPAETPTPIPAPEGSYEGGPVSPEPETATDATPAGTPSAPPQPEAAAAPAPETSHFIVNTRGLSIDEAHAGAYLDTQGNHIIYGGSLDDRAEIAKQLVAKDRSAIVFFDSTRSEKFLGLFERKVPHLSMAHWVEAGGESGVRIAEDTNDPSLTGMMLPTADDLAHVYKPTN